MQFYIIKIIDASVNVVAELFKIIL